MSDKILHQVIRYAAGIGEGNFNEPNDIVHKGYVDSRIKSTPKWRATADENTNLLELSLPFALPLGLYCLRVFVVAREGAYFKLRFNNQVNEYFEQSTLTDLTPLPGSDFDNMPASIDYYKVFTASIAANDTGYSVSLFTINELSRVKGQIGQVLHGNNPIAMSSESANSWQTSLGANVGAISSVQLFSDLMNAIGAGSFVEIERIG